MKKKKAREFKVHTGCLRSCADTHLSEGHVSINSMSFFEPGVGWTCRICVAGDTGRWYYRHFTGARAYQLMQKIYREVCNSFPISGEYLRSKAFKTEQE